MRSTRSRIMGIAVLVVLICTGLFFWIGYQLTSENMSRQIKNDYSVVAEQYAQKLTAWINQHYAGFQHPYGNSRGVPQAAFLRAKNAGNRTTQWPALRILSLTARWIM